MVTVRAMDINVLPSIIQKILLIFERGGVKQIRVTLTGDDYVILCHVWLIGKR